MTIKFLTRKKRGSPLSLKLKFEVTPEADPDLTLAGNPTLPMQAQAIVSPNLTNAAIRLQFFNYKDRLKTDTAPALLTLTSFVEVKNTATERIAIAHVTGAQTATWKPGEIWYMASITPVGGERFSEDDYSGSFILQA